MLRRLVYLMPYSREANLAPMSCAGRAVFRSAIVRVESHVARWDLFPWVLLCYRDFRPRACRRVRPTSAAASVIARPMVAGSLGLPLVFSYRCVICS
jgi:hypothetical protein